jgi:hypothetical protein
MLGTTSTTGFAEDEILKQSNHKIIGQIDGKSAPLIINKLLAFNDECLRKIPDSTLVRRSII